MLALLAPLAGIWIAVRKDQILNTVRAYSKEFDHPIIGGWGDVAILIAVFAILGIGFAVHKAAEAAIAKERQVQLHGSIVKLDKSVSSVDNSHRKLDSGIGELQKNVSNLEQQLDNLVSLRLRRVAAQFQAAIEETYSVLLGVFNPTATSDDIAKAIRVNTGQFNSFVRALDGEPGEVQYSCSIFVFRSVSELEEAESRQSKKCALLLAKHKVFGSRIRTDDDNLAGILELRYELNDIGGEYPSEPFVLPVERTLPSTLPGAPYCAVSERYSIFRSVKDLVEWCEKSPLLNKWELGKIRRHFEASRLKSFISIPLFEPTISGVSTMIGVLCIEKSADNILIGTSVDVFVSLTSPLQLFLAQLLSLYKTKLHL